MSQFEIKKVDDKFLRPIDKDDVKYRRIKRATFEQELQKVLPQDCTLCFHGTTIWNTEKILKSGNISAEIDRVGKFKEALDMPGKISVSTINNIWFTIKHFSDLGNYKYPAGCIFVITPNNNDEIVSAKEHNIINNVCFKTQPGRLKAIITTPENIERVKAWVTESGLNVSPDIVVDYDTFINICKSNYVNEKTL